MNAAELIDLGCIKILVYSDCVDPAVRSSCTMIVPEFYPSAAINKMIVSS